MSLKKHLTQRLSLIILTILLLCPRSSKGQDHQFWFDSFTYWTFSQRWEYELNIGANYLLKENGWKDYYINNSITYEHRWWCPTDAAIELHFTNDPQALNSTEERVSLGQKFIFTRFMEAIHLEKPYIYGRYDYRVINYLDNVSLDTTDIKQRIRFRMGGRFILNNTVVEAKSIYIPFYYEKFFNINDEAIERFAARDRLVVGLGYAFTNKLRSEFTYYYVRSRNTYEDKYETADIVYQIQIKYYIY